METIFAYLRERWDVISSAPLAFGAAVVLGAIAAWMAATTLDGRQIAELTTQRDGWRDSYNALQAQRSAALTAPSPVPPAPGAASAQPSPGGFIPVKRPRPRSEELATPEKRWIARLPYGQMMDRYDGPMPNRPSKKAVAPSEPSPPS